MARTEADASPGLNAAAPSAIPRPSSVVSTASIITVAFMGSVIVTPLYPAYQERFAFSEITLTLVYGVYVVGNVVALLMFGQISDQVGRKRVALPALAVAAGSAMAFLVADGTAWLYVGRLLIGLAVGILSGTGTAWLAEHFGPSRRSSATVVAATANMVGIALGPLVGGLLAQYAPAPLTLPFVTYIIVLAVVAIVIGRTPEPVGRRVDRLREIRVHPRIGVPRERLGSFAAPAVTGFVIFALGGLYFALIPSIVIHDLRESNLAAGGLVVFELGAIAATCIVLARRISPAKATLNDYAGYIRRCVQGSPLVADLTISEANDIGRIETWLTEIADSRGEAAAKQSRKVLKGILDLAERRGAIPASVVHRVHTPGAAAGSAGDRKCTDPDCDGDCGKRHLDTKRAFTVAEAQQVQISADASKADLGDLAAFLFGTGARISEALRCVDWADLDLDRQTVRVRGTKSLRADRTLKMSTSLADRLRTRADLHGTTGLVFGVTRYNTKFGKPRDRNNVLKSLRLVLTKAGINWAGSHTFRRTVATWMDDAGASLAEIANQLGHADTNVTAAYLGRTTEPTRAAEIMVLPAPSTPEPISGE